MKYVELDLGGVIQSIAILHSPASRARRSDSSQQLRNRPTLSSHQRMFTGSGRGCCVKRERSTYVPGTSVSTQEWARTAQERCLRHPSSHRVPPQTTRALGTGSTQPVPAGVQHSLSQMAVHIPGIGHRSRALCVAVRVAVTKKAQWGLETTVPSSLNCVELVYGEGTPHRERSASDETVVGLQTSTIRSGGGVVKRANRVLLQLADEQHHKMQKPALHRERPRQRHQRHCWSAPRPAGRRGVCS